MKIFAAACIAFVSLASLRAASPCDSTTVWANGMSFYRHDSGLYGRVTSGPQYRAGESAGYEYRNFAFFWIPTLSRPIQSAQLWVNAGQLVSGDGAETLVLHHASRGTNYFGTAITAADFSDLADGPTYGQYTFTAADNNNYVAIPLNQTFLTDLAAASGGSISLGGVVSTLDGTTITTEIVCNGSSSVQLEIIFAGPSPPMITTYPNAGLFLVSDDWLMNVGACGDEPLFYQWYKDNEPLGGATNASLYFQNLQVSNSGTYVCVVTNAAGSASTFGTSLAVVPIYISQNPASSTIPVGGSFQLQAGGYSRQPIDYRWYHDGQLILGATTTSLSVNNAQPSDQGQYFAVLSNSFGVVTTAVATITIHSTPPYWYSEPEGQAVPLGKTVTLKGLAFGDPTPDYYWLRDGQPFAARTGPGVTLANITPAQAGSYVLIASNFAGVITSRVATITVVPEEFLDSWKLVRPAPNGDDVLDFASGQGRVVGVGTYGLVLSTTDGMNWTKSEPGTRETLKAVTFGGDRFVAVGDHVGTVSTNGVDWTAVFPGTHQLSAITYGNGLFIAARFYERPKFLISTNGLNWTHTTDLAPNDFMTVWDMTFANGLFVAIGNLSGGTAGVARSTDGTNWITGGPGISSLGALAAITYGNGRFVAVDEWFRRISSIDAVSWQLESSFGSFGMGEVVYGNGIFVNVGGGGYIWQSTNGTNWTYSESGTTADLHGAGFGHGLFFAASDDGSILKSTDGLVWTNANGGPRPNLDGIAVTNGFFLGVGVGGTFMTSSNLVDFTFTNFANAEIHGATFADGKYVAVGKSGSTYSSLDGVNWTFHASSSSRDLKNVTFGKGLFVAVGETKAIITSSNGIDWATQVSPGDSGQDWNDIVFANGRFVVVGDEKSQYATLISTNGTNWALGASFKPKNLRTVTFGDGRFMAAGNDGDIYSSTNGVNWTNVPTPVFSDGNNLRSITYANGVWVAVGNTGIILSSRDGTNWTRHYSPVAQNLHGVRYWNGSFVAIGNGGVVLQSDVIASSLDIRKTSEGCELTLTPGLGQTHWIEGSADLIHWTRLAQPTGTPPKYIDPPDNTNRFYRAISPE